VLNKNLSREVLVKSIGCWSCLMWVLAYPLSVTAGEKVPSNQRTITIASCSLLPRKWDKPFNYQKMERMIRDAAVQGADLMVTPEGALDGYVIGEVRKSPNKEEAAKKYLAVAEHLDGDYVTRFRNLARELRVYLVVGFAERAGDRVYNTAALIDRKGEIVGVYHKNHGSNEFFNPPFNYPGEDIPVFDTEFGKLGIMICYDRQIPEVATCLALKGARLILVPSYGSRGEWNDILIRTRARDTGAVTVFTHPEQSLIADKSGNLVARSDGSDQLLIQTVDLPKKPFKTLLRRRPELYTAIVEPNRHSEKVP